MLSFGFGKNKVQYMDFKWKRVKSPHFHIHFHQNQDILAEIAPFWIENAYLSLEGLFDHTQKNHIPLVIYGNTNLFTQTNIITELLPEEVGGFTELFKNRIAVPFNGSYRELRHVLHHELVHAFMFGMLFDNFGSNLLVGNVQLPLWFMEGSAEFLSSRWNADADMFMIDRTLNSAIPLPGPALSGYLAYKGGQSFLYFLFSSRGDSLFKQFMLEFKKTKKVDVPLKKVYKKPVDELGKEWIMELRRLYWPEIGLRTDPSKQAKAVTDHIKTRDRFNLNPRISPKGDKVAFFSDRKDYTRILVTDLKGKILHEISHNGYGGYFESFHPFRSGICWSPDGTRLAFVTKSNGSDEIRIVDIKKKKLLKRIRSHLNSISNPDWSRDGKMLTFTSVDKGKNDLYLYRMESDSLTRLTNTLSHEDCPRFSPDNSLIIFSIEDTCGSLPDGTSPYGLRPSDLAVFDIAADTLRRLSPTPWNEKQPCFSPDGNHILFVSNRNGINNIYIAPFDSLDHEKPLTNYTGGCSNPDWSQKNNQVVFSLFHKQGWDIWRIKDPLKEMLPDTLLPTRWVASFNDSNAVFFSKVELPPDSTDSSSTAISDTAPTDSSGNSNKTGTEGGTSADAGIVTDESDISDSSALSKAIDQNTVSDSTTRDMVASAESRDETFASDAPVDTTDAVTDTATDDTITLSSPQPYRLTFSPDMVSVGLGVSTTYSPAGQVLIALSDLMGDHRITFAGDIQGDFKDYAHLFLSYLFLKQRIDFGAGGFYSKDYTFASIFGDRFYHDLQYGGFGIAQYPFTMFSRLELQLFGRHIEQKPVTFSGKTLTANMFLSSLAYVFDNILWGITGPLNGMRARAGLQMSPPLASITESYFAFDADLRKYLHLFRRFVWANRLYVGASFPLGQDYSARRYLLGGNDQWIIYRVNIDEYEKNMPFTYYSDFVTPFRGWNYADMSGTRVAVLNTEFRFPFIREISLVWPLPVQIRYINAAVFADIGNAWEAGEKYKNLPLPGKIHGGFGFGMRANLGMFVFRFDRGWPTDKKKPPVNYFSLGAEF